MLFRVRIFRRFHLNREMVDAEFVVQFRAERFQQFGLRNFFLMNDVNAQCVHSRSDRPDVQIVNVRDKFGRADRFFDGFQINMRGRAFEQNIDRFFYQIPRAENYYQADEDTRHRISPNPAERIDQNARRDRRDRTERVTHHVKPRAAHIQIVLVVRMKQVSRQKIDEKSADRNRSEFRALHFGLGVETFVGFVNDEQGKQNERDAVDKSGENLKTVITEGFLCRRRTRCKPDRRERQRERGNVRQHMPRIGDQRERIGQPSADKFGDHINARQTECELQIPQTFCRTPLVRMMVMMVMCADKKLLPA